MGRNEPAVFSKIIGVSRQHLCDIEHNCRIVSPKTAADFTIKPGHSPIQFVRLAVQDEFDKYGLNFDIQITEHKAISSCGNENLDYAALHQGYAC